jgi:hypothetical protein
MWESDGNMKHSTPKPHISRRALHAQAPNTVKTLGLFVSGTSLCSDMDVRNPNPEASLLLLSELEVCIAE